MLAADATARKIEKLINSINTSTTSLSTSAVDGGVDGEGVKDTSASDLQSELLTFIDESEDYMKNMDRFDSAGRLLQIIYTTKYLNFLYFTLILLCCIYLIHRTTLPPMPYRAPIL
jgi:hypothetical protein